MRLKNCKMGILVMDAGRGVGHIIGLTYNVHVKYTAGMDPDELLERTIPIVRFADGHERAIHPSQLEEFVG